MPQPDRPTWLEISRSALQNNVAQMRTLIGPHVRLMAVVKANAYGHGAIAIAPILEAAGVDRFAVATLSEALELRAAGIGKPILVLGYTPGRLAHDALRSDVHLTVCDLDTATAYDRIAASNSGRLTVHVKINTGMNRLGLAPGATPAALQALVQLENLAVEGLYTHFATADLADKRHTLEQFARFTSLLESLRTTRLCPRLVHAANSAAALTLPQTRLQMVRTGIALYGMAPDADETPLPRCFRPALSWKAHVAQVRTLQPGDAVSYGREFVATEPMTVAVLPVGYADGFPRRPQNWGTVLVHGRPAALLGRVCMDQTVVDVSAIVAAGEDVRQGDEAVLIGRQGDNAITAEDAGTRTGTINYDVTSRVLARVPRLIVA